MADNAEVMARINKKEGVSYPVLVPNMKGFDAALAAGATEIAVFAAASETFSQKNINCGIAESLARFRPVADAAKENGVRVRGYISCVLGCPYEGDLAPRATADVAASLLAMGCYEISLGDTIGTGTPGRAQAMVDAVADEVPRSASPDTSTTPTGRRSRTSSPAWSAASPSSTAPSRASAVVPTPAARRATSPPRTCSTCSRDSASRPESIWMAS